MAFPSRGVVLLADDDAGFREMTRLLLTRNGFECDAVASGQDVEAALRAREYELLVSDIDMPGNRDLRVVASLPQLQAGLPVILVTGAPTVESAVRSVGLSVAAYLVKPLVAEVFLELLTGSILRFVDTITSNFIQPVCILARYFLLPCFHI